MYSNIHLYSIQYFQRNLFVYRSMLYTVVDKKGKLPSIFMKNRKLVYNHEDPIDYHASAYHLPNS